MIEYSFYEEDSFDYSKRNIQQSQLKYKDSKQYYEVYKELLSCESFYIKERIEEIEIINPMIMQVDNRTLYINIGYDDIIGNLICSNNIDIYVTNIKECPTIDEIVLKGYIRNFQDNYIECNFDFINKIILKHSIFDKNDFSYGYLNKCTIHIELRYNNVPYMRQYTCLEHFRYLRHFNQKMINILLGNDSNLDLDTQSLLDINKYLQNKSLSAPNLPKLNNCQKETIKKCITKRVSCIIGPPGTGKTNVLASLCYFFYNFNINNNKKILICSSSNSVCEHIASIIGKTKIKLLHLVSCSKEKIIGNEGYTLLEKMGEKVYNRKQEPYEKNYYYNDEELFLSKADRKKFLYNMSVLKHKLHAYLQVKDNKKIKNITARIKQLKKIILSILNIKDQNRPNIIGIDKLLYIENKKVITAPKFYYSASTIINKAKVVITTNICAVDIRLKESEFDYVIMDEAGKSTETESIVPVSKNCKQLIMIGDDKQLPPTILNQKVKEYGFDISLFERLIKSNTVTPHSLIIQYRMNPKLIYFSNLNFYNKALQSGVTEAQKTILKNNIWPFNTPNIFVDINSKEEINEISKSLYNNKEIDYILRILKYLKHYNVDLTKVMIITFYSAQHLKLKNKLSHKYRNVEINTIDGSQGKEKEIIIISTVRANNKKTIGFLKDVRRLNVALTRCKTNLILLGNSSTLINDDIWSKLIQYYKDISAFITPQISQNLFSISTNFSLLNERIVNIKNKKKKNKKKNKRKNI